MPEANSPTPSADEPTPRFVPGDTVVATDPLNSALPVNTPLKVSGIHRTTEGNFHLQIEGYLGWWKESRFELAFAVEPPTPIPSPVILPGGIQQFTDSATGRTFAATPLSWTREQYLLRFRGLLKQMYSLTYSKNSDYADTDDAFQNFRNVESAGIASMEVGILTRISDKFQRSANLIKRDAVVSSESVTDSLLDLAVYSLILICAIESKRS